MKKFIALSLSMLMLFSTTNVFANNFVENQSSFDQFDLESTYDNQAIITTDNNLIRVSESSDNEFTYISTFYKKENIVILEQFNNNGLFVSEFKYDLNDTANFSINNGIDVISPFASSLNQNTLNNYEYTKWYGTPETWELRRPNPDVFEGTYYFYTYKDSSNSSYIDKFYNHVESINKIEKEALTLMSFGLVSSASAVIMAATPGGLPAFVASVGIYGNSAIKLYELEAECNKALDQYYNIYYYSKTIFN